MIEPIRISTQEAKSKVSSGSALLVCAYDDEEKFKLFHLQGATSFAAFKAKLPRLSKNQEIIFYCAWPKEATAAGQAAKYIDAGYKNVTVLGGGVEGWKAAGYPMGWE